MNAQGAAPMFACRAWVNFNGTGTVAIRSSGNVSSITDSGTGTYTVNFTTAMQDANYGVNITASSDSATAMTTYVNGTGAAMTTTTVAIQTASDAGTAVDRAYVGVSIIR